MKFSTVAILFAGAALAAPTQVEREVSLVERDYATVSSVIAQIQGLVSTLNQKAAAYQGKSQTASVKTASDNVLSAISSGNSKISSGTALTLNEAFQVANQVDGLTTVVNSTINTIIGKKSLVVAAGDQSLLLGELNKQKSGAQQLGDTIKSKVPSGAQSIATQKTNTLTGVIQRGITAYS